MLKFKKVRNHVSNYDETLAIGPETLVLGHSNHDTLLGSSAARLGSIEARPATSVPVALSGARAYA